MLLVRAAGEAPVAGPYTLLIGQFRLQFFVRSECGTKQKRDF